jgi:hypothetical protein
MRKSKFYEETIFDSEFIELAVNMFSTLSGSKDFDEAKVGLSVSIHDETWSYDTFSEFLADYQKSPEAFYLMLRHKEYAMTIKCEYLPGFINVSINAPSRGDVVKLFNQFDRNAKRLHIEPADMKNEEDGKDTKELSETEKPTIFIGHGRNTQ